MSQENVRSFFKAIEEDEDFREKISAQFNSNNPADEENAMNAMVQVASENGYQFSVEDMKDVAEQSKDMELNDEQLDNIAGGTVGVAFMNTQGRDWVQVCILIGFGGKDR